MGKRYICALSVLLILFLMISGCQSTETPAATTEQDSSSEAAEVESASSSTSEDSAKTIGLVQIDLSHPFHLGEVEGAKEAARRNGFELKVTSGEGDVNKQIQAFENLVNEGVDAIAVNFIDVNAFGPAMKKAEEAGIPVICLHSQTDGCATMLGFDEWYTGRTVGEYAVTLLEEDACWGEGCEVANLQGLLGQGLNEARSGGFVEIMEKYPENIEVVSQEPTDWQPEKAVAAMENWLVAYPELNMVYGNSDGLTVPAAETAQAAGRNDIIFVSVDGSDFALEAVKGGTMASTFLYAPEYAGYWKAWVPFKAAMGESLEDEILIKGTLVNSDNVDAILDLAQDQQMDIQNFPFEEELSEIIKRYQSAETTGEAEPEEPKTIGLVQIDLSHPFHLGEVEGAKEAARRNGFELKVTSGEGDVNKQIQAFENLVNEGVDAIAVNFIDVNAFGPAMKKAEEAGIPVICLHSQTDGCATMLGFDEWYTGRTVGEYAVTLLEEDACWGEGCEVANLQGLLGQGLNEARSGGFVEIMEKYPENIEVVSQEPTDWQPEKAVAAMENWLVAYPELNMVYGNSDGLTVPAAETAQAAGRDDIIFVSVDGSDFALEAVKGGTMASTFLYAPEYAGYWKAWVPFKAAMGESLEDEILIKGTLVNSDNVDAILELAQDQKEDIQNFPFGEQLSEIIESYLK